MICKLNTFTRAGGVGIPRESNSLSDFFLLKKSAKVYMFYESYLGEKSNIITYPNPDVLILRLVEPSNQNLYLKQQRDYHQTLTGVSRKTCNQLLLLQRKPTKICTHTKLTLSASSMYYINIKTLHYTML